MGNKASDTFAFDLENRLDDFFKDPEPAQDAARDEAPSSESSPDTSLKALKSTILAIDWEITDEGLDAFIGQVDELSETFKTDRTKHTLLRLLNALGRYMRKHKSAAHPDSIKRIMAVYSSLEEIVENRGLTTEEKEKILIEEVRQFKQLKAKITESRASGSRSAKTAVAGASELGAIMDEINALKSMMKTELSALQEAIARLGGK